MSFENPTTEPHADFDADFSGELPLLLNIWNRRPGTGEGYEVFKKFLEQVGSGKNFLSTAVTDDGKRLFEKAVNNNLIEMVAPERGIRQFSEWRVL